MKIVNFSVLTEEEKIRIEAMGEVTHYGAALGIEKDPTEPQMIEILSKEQPDILIVNSAPVTSKVIDCLKGIRLIICARGTPINVDSAYCKSKNIPFTHTPGRNANGVAEYTLCMIIAALRNIPQSISAIREKQCTLNIPVEQIRLNQKDVVWMHPSLHYEPYCHFLGNEITGKTLGLVGFGFIGQKLAQKASALGMNILAYDPYLPQDVFVQQKVRSVSLDELLEISDVISLHAKSGNKPLIGEKELKKMKPDALLINTARSALIDNEALLWALKAKKIRGAVLDVFPYEPLSSYDPLLEPIEGLILTPHIAGATRDVAIHQSRMILETMEAYMQSKPLPYLVK